MAQVLPTWSNNELTKIWIMTNLAFLKVLTLSSITAGGESQSALKLSEMKVLKNCTSK